MTAVAPSQSATNLISVTAGAVERRVRPVVGWAVLGAGFLVLQAYVFGAWFWSGDATRTDPGPTPVPGWMGSVAVVWTIAGIGLTFLTLYWFVVRPLRRERRMSLDGLFVLAFFTVYWQDPLLSYTQAWSTYNASMPNIGSWARHIPGWMAPNGNQIAEPVLWVLPTYIYGVFIAVVAGNAVMRKAKVRWPRLGTFGMVMLAWGMYGGLWLLVEPILMRLGIYTYAGSIEWLTLFHGHYYQFPIYEAVFWGATTALWACARYFRDDRGHTLAERGLDRVNATGRRRTAIRFLALVGILNVVELGGYNVPIQFFALHASPWPADVQNRSYLTDGLCGPGTTYACPGPGIPVNRPDSVHITPSGTLAGSVDR